MEQLSDEVRDFLNEPERYAVLATIGKDGLPQQTVMWYILDGDEVLMNTADGRVKDNNLARDPRASICVEDGYRYVTITGTVVMNDDQQVAQADIRRLAGRYGDEAGVERGMQDMFSKEHRVTLRLKIENVVINGFGSLGEMLMAELTDAVREFLGEPRSGVLDKTITAVAELLAVHYDTVQTWVRWYRQGGLAEVRRHLSGGRQGRKPLLSAPQQQ